MPTIIRTKVLSETLRAGVTLARSMPAHSRARGEWLLCIYNLPISSIHDGLGGGHTDADTPTQAHPSKLRPAHTMPLPGRLEMRRMVQNVIFAWNHYMHQVERLAIYFDNKSNKQYAARVLRPPMARVVLPIGLSLFMMVRAMIVLYGRQATNTAFKRLLLGTEILPVRGRNNLETTILFWSVMHILFVGHGLLQPIVKFSFLAIFVVRPKGAIRPANLDLSAQDYHKLNKWREKAMMLLYVTIVSMAFNVAAVAIIQAFRNRCFDISIVITLFYLVLTFPWTIFICYSEYR